MMADILQLHHVTIITDNPKESLNFYENVLNLTNDADSAATTPDYAHLMIGNGQEIHLREGDVPAFAGQHFALEVADTEKIIKELEARGVPFRLPRSERRTLLHIKDPSGNDIELRQSR